MDLNLHDMTLASAFLLERRELEASALMIAHPPRLTNAHKRAVFELVRDTPVGGQISYSRWRARELPERLGSAVPKIEVLPEVFDYRDAQRTGVWHVNFADPQLFVAYGSSLLAQDELQVLEHPVLGSLRESLLSEGLPAVTEERGAPTPVLITGAARRFALDTSVTIDRRNGLYGNHFAAAPFADVRAALTVLDPPTMTNLLAMAAPVGRGQYRPEQLAGVLSTAFAGFSAARDESRARWPGSPVEVRTGFWGCGAFGGNRLVMVALQWLAARLAGLDHLCFYAVDRSGGWDVEEALEAIRPGLTSPETRVSAILERFAARRDRWGTSDGN